MATHKDASAQAAAQPPDPTFRNYAIKAAQDYANLRPAYPPPLVELVLAKHTSTGGLFNTLLDVGCGPGTATRQFALHFQHATGADPGSSMISVASTADPPIVTAAGQPATFHICSAEDISTLHAAETVDLITVATALHWFDLPRFYTAAARCLKPGGTLAIWTASNIVVDPDTTPNAAVVQAVFDRIQVETLGPYEMPGNRAVRELYAHLDTPFTLAQKLDQDPQFSFLAEFDEASSERVEFNLGGRQEPTLVTQDNPKGFLRAYRAPIEMLRRSIGTASPVTRWREAHKEALEKGEVVDVVDEAMAQARAALDEMPEGKERDWIDMVTPMVLFLYKKKARSSS